MPGCLLWMVGAVIRPGQRHDDAVCSIHRRPDRAYPLSGRSSHGVPSSANEANAGMPVIEPNVTKDKLVQLLDEGAESETLDFKETCNLSSKED